MKREEQRRKEGHFLGNNTVIDVLRRQGYHVEHTPAGKPPFLHELPHKEDEEGRPLEDDLLPHMLLPPDSLELLEKAERKMLKKKRRNKQKKQRHRHFNDLWVRIEESLLQRFNDMQLSTMVQSPPPPLVRIINGYITVQPPDRVHSHHHHISSAWTASSTSSSLLVFLCTLLTVIPQAWTVFLE
ncbi:Metalloprotease TIKI1 [Liparis tanakae]|uniref:Metalloprotease TIKI n=1 Tax=Liparis tanakae TaxID=230148 RepID=A0A4Z2I0F5_9TELE|nr:Metalloprotease TIKI1 [Liparis tanakae]